MKANLEIFCAVIHADFLVISDCLIADIYGGSVVFLFFVDDLQPFECRNNSIKGTNLTILLG